MKKNFLAALFSCLAITQFATPGHTQATNMLATPANELAAIAPAANTASPKGDLPAVYVKARVMNAFTQLFNSPQDVQWNLSDNHYLATFKNDGQVCRALFDAHGGFLYSMKYGTQDNLPRDIYRMIKSTYIDFAITLVTEVNTPEQQAWIVNLQDKNELVIAHVVDEQLEELHRYKTHF